MQPAPFANIGACCWFNSLIQSMLSIPCLNDLLCKRKLIFQSNPVASSYIALYEAHTADASQVAAAHQRLLDVFSQSRAFTSKKMMLGRQACAEEGFSVLIEALNSHDVSMMCANAYSSSLLCMVCDATVPIKREISFEIHMKTPVVFATQEEFCDWIHVHEDRVEDFECRTCHAATNMIRIDTLGSIHEVVVCCFDAPFADKPKWFPVELKFPSVIPGVFLVYELVAKIERGGVSPSKDTNYNSAGHYWAHVKRGACWYRADDASISPGNSTPTPETFIVMYAARPS